VASFELTEFLLCRCASLSEARRALTGLRITDEAFSASLPPTPLHWMLSDGRASLVIEATKAGLQVYDNPTGVLTNAPEFPWHQRNLTRFSPLQPHERAFGLPGDYTSEARFVRAAFVRESSLCEKAQELSQLFHILRAVEIPRGCVRTEADEAFFTRYTGCCDLEQLTYHILTYDSFGVRSACMHGADLDGTAPKQLLAL